MKRLASCHKSQRLLHHSSTFTRSTIHQDEPHISILLLEIWDTRTRDRTPRYFRESKTSSRPKRGEQKNYLHSQEYESAISRNFLIAVSNPFCTSCPAPNLSKRLRTKHEFNWKLTNETTAFPDTYSNPTISGSITNDSRISHEHGQDRSIPGSDEH